MAEDKSLANLAKDYFLSVAKPVALGSNAALLNTVKYPLAAIEAGTGGALDLFGLGPGRGVGNYFNEALGEYEGALSSAKEENPVIGTGAELAGGVLSPLNKLKIFQTIYNAGGPLGVLGRAGVAAGESAIANIGEDDVAGAAEDAAALSAGFDALSGLFGKAGKAASTVLKKSMGLGKADYTRIARKYGKVANKADLDRAYDIVKSETPFKGKELLDSSENVLNSFYDKITSAIERRESAISKILGAADSVPRNKPLELDIDPVLNKFQKIREGLQGKDVEDSFLSTADEMLSKFKEIAGKQPSLQRLQETKKLLNKSYKLDPAHIDARSSVTDAFRTTIEKEVDRLAKAGTIPAEYAGAVKKANLEIRDLLELKNSVGGKLPGAELDDPLLALQRSLFTTGTGGAVGAGQLAEALGGSKGAAMLGGMASTVDRIKRPLAATIEKVAPNISSIFSSPGIRQGVVSGVDVKRPPVEFSSYELPVSDEITKEFINSLGSSNEEDALTNEFIKSLQNDKTITSSNATSSNRAEKKTDFPSDALLDRLAMVESSNNPKARSKAGALGMYQFMPATAKELGIDPFDPIQAREGARRYLASLYNQLGDPELALAAYNAGIGRVQEYGGIPPFEETQNYVKKFKGLI